MENLKDTNDIKQLMWSFVTSAALNTALEKGLFWEIEKKKMSVKDIAHLYSIPIDRCRKWLILLIKLGLLEEENNLLSVSKITTNTIFEYLSRDAWKQLSIEARESYSAINNLTNNISHPKSVWEAQSIRRISYIEKMKDDPTRAASFTRMLYEIHKDLAIQISNQVDLNGICQMLDLGGGSGVNSFALLRKKTDLRSIVYDIENVCSAGRLISDEVGLSDRIDYVSGNFLDDELPGNVDLVLFADVGIYTERLFSKIKGVLKPKGRFVIVSNTNEQGAWLYEQDEKPSLRSLIYSFLSSLGVAEVKENTVMDVEKLLVNVGFIHIKTVRLDEGVILMESTKGE